MPEPILLEFSGRTLPELFENAALGMFSLLIDPAEVSIAMLERVHVEAKDFPGLLIAWLNELIYIFQTNRIAPRGFRVIKLTETILEVEVKGELMDPFRHHPLREIKSACEPFFQEVPGGYHGRVLFDV